MGKKMKKALANLLRRCPKAFDFVRSTYCTLHKLRGRTIRYNYLMDEENKVAYLVNAKAACTSIKVSMYKGGQTPDDYSIHRRKDRRMRGRKPFADPEYFTFTYVRDPFQRLVSCYESKYHSDPGKGKSELDFDHYLFGLMKRDRGFEAFLRKVVAIPDWLADPHFRSQYNLIYRRGKPTVDFVGKMETIARTYPPIQQKYGYDPLKTYNKSQHQDYRTYYTPRLVRQVYKKYRKDIEFLGYREAYEQLLSFSRQRTE